MGGLLCSFESRPRAITRFGRGVRVFESVVEVTEVKSFSSSLSVSS